MQGNEGLEALMSKTFWVSRGPQVPGLMQGNEGLEALMMRRRVSPVKTQVLDDALPASPLAGVGALPGHAAKHSGLAGGSRPRG